MTNNKVFSKKCLKILLLLLSLLCSYGIILYYYASDSSSDFVFHNLENAKKSKKLSSWLKTGRNVTIDADVKRTSICFEAFWNLTVNSGKKTVKSPNADKSSARHDFESNVVVGNDPPTTFTGTPLAMQRSNNCYSYIVLKLKPGRLGNQMFQVASLIGIAKKNHLIPVVNEEMKITQLFNLPDFKQKFTMRNMATVETSDTSGKYRIETEKMDPVHNWTLKGHLQSWRYFEAVKETIRRLYTIDERIKTTAMKFLNSPKLAGL